MRQVFYNPLELTEDTVPVSIYRDLPPGTLDPLPEAYMGKIYHYTTASTVISIVDSNLMLASHIEAMNDPSERVYGWKSISRRFGETRSNFSEFAGECLEDIFSVSMRANWLPQIFALCGSRSRDNLTQYRMYGQMCVEIEPGMWAHRAEEDPWSANTRLSSWRPVLYGRKTAEGYIDTLLQVVSGIIDQAYAVDLYKEVEIPVILLLQMASLYIKHPAYKSEKEVRLVFAVRQWADSLPYARASGDRIVSFVRATVAQRDPEVTAMEQHQDHSLVRSVTVGPLAGGEVSRRGLSAHLQRRFPKDDIEVLVSKKPYAI